MANELDRAKRIAREASKLFKRISTVLGDREAASGGASERELEGIVSEVEGTTAEILNEDKDNEDG